MLYLIQCLSWPDIHEHYKRNWTRKRAAVDHLLRVSEVEFKELKESRGLPVVDAAAAARDPGYWARRAAGMQARAAPARAAADALELAQEKRDAATAKRQKTAAAKGATAVKGGASAKSAKTDAAARARTPLQYVHPAAEAAEFVDNVHAKRTSTASTKQTFQEQGVLFSLGEAHMLPKMEDLLRQYAMQPEALCDLWGVFCDMHDINDGEPVPAAEGAKFVQYVHAKRVSTAPKRAAAVCNAAVPLAFAGIVCVANIVDNRRQLWTIEDNRVRRLITIMVRGQDGTEVTFNVERTSPVRKFLLEYANQQGGVPAAYRFIFDGKEVGQFNRTPVDYDMEDGDTIDAMLEQGGGPPSPNLQIMIQGPEREDVVYKFSRYMMLLPALRRTFAAAIGRGHCFTWSFDGNRIIGTDTPHELSMSHGDVIQMEEEDL